MKSVLVLFLGLNLFSVCALASTNASDSLDEAMNDYQKSMAKESSEGEKKIQVAGSGPVAIPICVKGVNDVYMSHKAYVSENSSYLRGAGMLGACK
jgi:hypothetical protein